MTVPTSDALVLAIPTDMHTRVKWTERATQMSSPCLSIAERVSLRRSTKRFLNLPDTFSQFVYLTKSFHLRYKALSGSFPKKMWLMLGAGAV